ncbi:ParB/RepB/Spo0J family partition protein [Pelosinus fermentans]|uniref:ParB-like partition protein n=1 Tax=Pelosinus fermentans JBW45 TaxID=1192197 RepID=I8TUK3_9FIRM|nr:ParB/RepB/Spo0J family partition protein [Pelosinus fermentans]AJQ26894.1 parB-like partition protein [Pelosinus fermentans JBW45]
MIQNIEISKIHSHYDNPRKELGDLTELADSIKSNGIFQNLTVVPWFSKITGVGADNPKQQEEMGYIVVIGHRRLAAAKLAGLAEVPCAISNMSYRKQIATMLLENMQRNDLTVYEQAQGFQMMLDLGESINDISKDTGFSETTVRRRVKLLELDKEKFRQSVERGANLMEYAELEKIQDISLRNKVLDKIGTSNFKWELQNALNKEKNDKNEALIIAELEKFAKRIESGNGLQHIKSYYPSQNPEIATPDDTDTVEYFFQIQNYGAITLYKKDDNANQGASSQKDPVWLEKQRERDNRRAALDEISKRAYQLRGSFIKEISNAKAKKNMSVIIEYSLRAMLGDNCTPDAEEFAQFVNIEIKEDEENDLNFDNIKDQVVTQPERHLLTATYLILDSEREHYYDWNNHHDNNETLNTVYDFLEKLGYGISEEEQSLRDGTHKLLISLEE